MKWNRVWIWHCDGRKLEQKNNKFSNRTTRPSYQNRNLKSKEGITDINLQWEGRSSWIVKSICQREERDVQSRQWNGNNCCVFGRRNDSEARQGNPRTLSQCILFFVLGDVILTLPLTTLRWQNVKGQKR